MPSVQKISPCLWFNNEGEEAAKFYVTVFSNSRIGRVSRYTKEGQEIHGQKPGTVMTVEFELDGQHFTALNGGPQFKFSEAISLQVMCETQEEIDQFWRRLGAGGDEKAQQCGWLKDKFGLSWQVVPSELGKMMSDPDTNKASRVMKVMMQMKKLDLNKLREAYAGSSQASAQA